MWFQFPKHQKNHIAKQQALGIWTNHWKWNNLPGHQFLVFHSGIFFQSFGTNAHEIASRSSALQPELEPLVDCTWKNRYYLVLYWHLAIHLSYSILSYNIVYDITLPYISYISCIISLITLFRRLCFLDSENKEFVILQKLFQVCLFRPFSFLSSAATHSNDA